MKKTIVSMIVFVTVMGVIGYNYFLQQNDDKINNGQPSIEENETNNNEQQEDNKNEIIGEVEKDEQEDVSEEESVENSNNQNNQTNQNNNTSSKPSNNNQNNSENVSNGNQNNSGNTQNNNQTNSGNTSNNNQNNSGNNSSESENNNSNNDSEDKTDDDVVNDNTQTDTETPVYADLSVKTGNEEDDIEVEQNANDFVLSGTMKEPEDIPQLATNSYVRLKVIAPDGMTKEQLENAKVTLLYSNEIFTQQEHNFLEGINSSNAYFYLTQEFMYGQVISIEVDWGDGKPITYTFTFNIKFN